MEPFTSLCAVAAPLDRSNIDTGQILPSRFLRRPRGSGYKNLSFRDERVDGGGSERGDFVLNQTPYRDARILVVGANFGCGSSREAAVHALLDDGFRCILAPSFGEIFEANGVRNGLLPAKLTESAASELVGDLRASPGQHLTVDLADQSVRAASGRRWSFSIGARAKFKLLRGLDDCALALARLDEIETFRQAYEDAMPWASRSALSGFEGPSGG